MSDQQRPAKRRRKDPAVKDHLAQLHSQLAELDVDRAERERRQEAALTRYAEATVTRKQVEDNARSEVQRLRDRIADVEETARTDRQSAEVEQAEAMAELNDLGRTASDLSTLFGVPVKTVRRMIRTARPKTATSRATGEERTASAIGESPSTPDSSDETQTQTGPAAAPYQAPDSAEVGAPPADETAGSGAHHRSS